MTWVWVLLAGGVIYAVIFIIRKQKKDALLSGGQIINRGNDFIKQAHYFTTKTGSLAEVGKAIDQSVLAGQAVTFTPDYAKNMIVFRNASGGTSFACALRYIGAEGDQHKFRYQMEHWQGKYGPNDLAANATLTAVEKAFMRLDSATQVERRMAEYKTKSKFF